MNLIMGEYFSHSYTSAMMVMIRQKQGRGTIYNNYFLLFFRFLALDNVRIPKEYLMNKNCDITVDGRYVSAYKDPRKRVAANLGALSNGRVGITEMSVVNLKSCLPIAIRLIFYIIQYY